MLCVVIFWLTSGAKHLSDLPPYGLPHRECAERGECRSRGHSIEKSRRLGSPSCFHRRHPVYLGLIVTCFQNFCVDLEEESAVHWDALRVRLAQFSDLKLYLLFVFESLVAALSIMKSEVPK